MIFDLQKASFWKRISAFLFDGIILGVLIAGFAFIISAVTNYDGYTERLNGYYSQYETEYGVVFRITEEEYKSMTGEEAEKYDAAYAALCADNGAMHTYSMVINLTLLITTLSILFGFLTLEFAVPLRFGNGQTLGKKIFGIGLMRTDGVKMSPVMLFVRTILGKYTIETMVPVLILLMIYFNTVGLLGIVILGGILLLQIILLICTRTNSAIHDLLANTVAVDFASQMIFDSEEEMIEYKKKIHAEKAARQPY